VQHGGGGSLHRRPRSHISDFPRAIFSDENFAATCCVGPRLIREQSQAPPHKHSEKFREAGIDLVKQMLESRAAASGAVIEGAAKPVSMLSHAELEQPKRKPNRLMIEADTAVGKERKPRQHKVPSPSGA
jgi:hypothetical protein